MTREEYEKLLKSDYWKGYSYSLIKERNFICQDCGRSFYNERNKLQVHHLVYRDINPWSYRPEELVVLCEECHKRRHGILSNPAPMTDSTSSQASNSGYNKTYSYSRDAKEERSNNSGSATPNQPINPINFKHLIIGLLILFAFVGLWQTFSNNGNKKEVKEPTIQNVEKDAKTEGYSDGYLMENKDTRTYPKTNQRQKIKTEKNPSDNNYSSKHKAQKPESIVQQEESIQDNHVENSSNDFVSPGTSKSSDEELSTLELLERQNHASVVEDAKRAGVSTEGTTLEILERINHASVVEDAKRAGVSTEGTTLEILERINRKNMGK